MWTLSHSEQQMKENVPDRGETQINSSHTISKWGIIQSSLLKGISQISTGNKNGIQHPGAISKERERICTILVPKAMHNLVLTLKGYWQK